MIVECAVGVPEGDAGGPSGTACRVGHGGRLMVVADAVGPRARAEGAARQAVDAFVGFIPAIPATIQEGERLLRGGFEAANLAASVDERARGLAAPEGVALVAVLIVGENALVANVGSSRCYCARGCELTVLTRDHSGVAQLQTGFGALGRQPKSPPIRSGSTIVTCSADRWALARSAQMFRSARPAWAIGTYCVRQLCGPKLRMGSFATCLPTPPVQTTSAGNFRTSFAARLAVVRFWWRS